MGLTFSVGRPEAVFESEAAAEIRETLLDEYGASAGLDVAGDPHWSEEVAWSGWAALQKLARKQLAAARVEHLLSMEAWCGVYLPLQTEPALFELDGDARLDVASLPSLVGELEALGRVAGLPTADGALAELADKYSQDDDLVDADPDLQTYAQLLLAAHEAARRGAPLWVVK